MSAGLPVDVRALTHRYSPDGAPALDDVTFTLEAGSATAVIGPSGSGKSTLLTILAGLQKPTAGTVRLGPHHITDLTEPALLRLRRRPIAVLPQRADRALLRYATALQNLHFAGRGARSESGSPPDPVELLDIVGLTAHRSTPADRLSGGERQRLALAAALATAPALLLADEPTSSLDRPNRDHLIGLLLSLSARTGTTLVTITHDPDVAVVHDRQLHLRDGRIED